MSKNRKLGSRLIDQFLAGVERVGNTLPHPASLFGILAGFVILLSWIFSTLKVTVAHPATGEIVAPVNLISQYGLHRILTEMITNFTGFAPLGTVLVALLGIGVAESSGLIGTSLRLLVISAPRRSLTFVIVLSFSSQPPWQASLSAWAQKRSAATRTS